MAKTQLLKSTREALLEWMVKQLDERLKKELEKPLLKAIEVANKVIRAKYPEQDMIILRKYNCTARDNCLRFVNDDTGQLFGVLFPYREKDDTRLADLPRGTGCNNADVFKVTPSAQKIIEAYTSKGNEYKEQLGKKRAEYFSFLAACKTLEDVEAVVKLPDDIKRRYATNAALVAINPTVIAAIKKDFVGAV